MARAFPNLEDYQPATLAAAGYTPVCVSAVFERRLTDDEFTTLPFIFRKEALEKGLIADYLVLEKRFLTLYEALLDGPVSHVCANGRLRPIRPGARYREVILAGIREFRPFDLYFERYKARATVEFDLTHWFFLRDPDQAPLITKLAKDAGLFTPPYETLRF